MMVSWKKAAVHLVWSKKGVVILPTGFEKSLIYQLFETGKETQMV